MRRSDERDLLIGAVVVAAAATLVVAGMARRAPATPAATESEGGRAAVARLDGPPGASGGRGLEQPAPATPSSLAVQSASPPSETARQPAEPASPEGNPIPKLSSLYAALRDLEASRRSRHVRIACLGDSHTQADFWTNALRSALQNRFGAAGPGFVHLGFSENRYHHEGVRVRVSGGWSIEPEGLVTVHKVADGVFGLGGVRAVASDAGARAALEVDAASLPGEASLDFGFRLLDPDSAIEVAVEGGARAVASGAEAADASAGAIRRLTLRSGGPGVSFAVERRSGRPQLLGVVVESAGAPGVVVDTLGLNGARVVSALAFDEASWVEQLARRSPELVAVAYGSNESSDRGVDAERHTRHLRELVERIRKAAPSSDCLLLGPVDRAGAAYEGVVERINEVQRGAAAQLGCAFWSGQAAMGGRGGFVRWTQDKPPLASGDGLHLTARGYQRLGAMLARDLLAGFDGWRARERVR
jgi:lysophospholipase L1-like esterase